MIYRHQSIYTFYTCVTGKNGKKIVDHRYIEISINRIANIDTTIYRTFFSKTKKRFMHSHVGYKLITVSPQAVTRNRYLVYRINDK